MSDAVLRAEGRALYTAKGFVPTNQMILRV
jgi:hypothetical protein